MSRGKDGDDASMVTLSLRDEPPNVAPGTMVEIEVVERLGAAAYYANLLVFPTTGEVEKVFAARYLLEAGHQQYRRGREEQAGHEATDLWTGIARLLQLVAAMLEDYRSYSAWPHANVRIGKLGNQGRVLLRLVTSLRATMLNLLRDGLVATAPIWQVIDGSFADVVQRCDDLAAATDRVITQYRCDMATPRFLCMDEYLAAQVSGNSFNNHDDYLRAMQLARRTGLDMSRLVLGLYQDLEVVAVLRGVKR